MTAYVELRCDGHSANSACPLEDPEDVSDVAHTSWKDAETVAEAQRLAALEGRPVLPGNFVFHCDYYAKDWCRGFRFNNGMVGSLREAREILMNSHYGWFIIRRGGKLVDICQWHSGPKMDGRKVPLSELYVTEIVPDGALF